ncbi:hypothetical protein [Methylomonas sp. AM2-LC]|uniref:hypothetical protein n=1 Tax=Methylomonas sp. AM2-LC TaxID=3153301 RepID=UPI0032642D5D
MENKDNKKKFDRSANVASYPSARYFQLYFDILHEELNENKRIMENLQKQLSDLLIHVSKPQS